MRSRLHSPALMVFFPQKLSQTTIIIPDSTLLYVPMYLLVQLTIFVFECSVLCRQMLHDLHMNQSHHSTQLASIGSQKLSSYKCHHTIICCLHPLLWLIIGPMSCEESVAKEIVKSSLQMQTKLDTFWIVSYWTADLNSLHQIIFDERS